MKRMLLALFMVLTAAVAHAAVVTITWDDSTAGAKPDGYRLYYGNYSGNARTFVYRGYTTVSRPPATVTVNPMEKWYFRVTAYDATQESLFSTYVFVNFIRTPANAKFQRIDVR